MTGPAPHLMREPCRFCAADGVEALVGTIETRNGQDVVRCKRCERHCYNAPRAETGKPQRSLRSRPEVSPSQRARILIRDGGRCFLCGRDPGRHGVNLNVAHVLSVADAKRLEVPDEVAFDDANLIAACEECNSGMKDISLEPRIWLALIKAQMERRGDR